MRKIISLALILILAGCLQPNYEVIEELGGKYNSKLILEKVTTTQGKKVDVYRVLYNYNGKEQKAILPLNIIAAFEKIRQDTAEDELIFMWWDYASALRGYTGRDVLIDAPSSEILYSVAGEWEGDLSSDEKVRDLASLFSTNSSEAAIQIMEDYGSEFILVHKSDLSKAFVFFNLAEGDSGEFIKFISDGSIAPTEKGYHTMFFKMYRGDHIDGFNKFYSDDFTNIYKIKST